MQIILALGSITGFVGSFSSIFAADILKDGFFSVSYIKYGALGGFVFSSFLESILTVGRMIKFKSCYEKKIDTKTKVITSLASIALATMISTILSIPLGALATFMAEGQTV